MRGNITRRGKNSWRIKFDLGRDDITGKRRTRLVTVRGKRQDAEKELVRQLGAAHDGTFVDATKISVSEYLTSWLETTHSLSPKTMERFRQLVEQQIVPCLGGIALQKLKPIHVASWHTSILKSGGKGGKPLSPSTVGQAHRVLHLALAKAVKTEIIARNVASNVSPPSVERKEVQCLKAGQMAFVLKALDGHYLLPIVALALATGMRRGELLALRWSDVDLVGCSVKVERSLEQIKTGLRFKGPKTKYGRRTISLPINVVEALKLHRLQQMEQRIANGLGRAGPDALMFCDVDGSPMSPLDVSCDWRDAVRSREMPKVTFHALRHSHASALLAAGVDVLTVSRRLGHASAVVTLTVYAHLIRDTDQKVANTIDAAMRTGIER